MTWQSTRLTDRVSEDWVDARIAKDGRFIEATGFTVSSLGQVVGPDGYPRAHLNCNGHAYANLGPVGRRTIGSVMLASFSNEPPSPGNVVMYLDKDPTNLCLDNLTWARKVLKIKGPASHRKLYWVLEPAGLAPSSDLFMYGEAAIDEE